ncbi:ABC transporter ATP-binding protein [Nonomuraea spiralis]|uniref:ABC transporter ATP-binding protein n=1 Tax=Nonomuraea spiralis TaxID=46182 RepID=A0ABV5J132_9ACTN|nr:ABC transporter ATP-binding protein [Nonomuraea spiralis]GGT19352.1 ABC transporter ATP-binding protein [Nonomuraea spiralis]
MSVLRITDLRMWLPGAPRPVLDGIDLSVAPGETVALVGESGSGKSLTSRTVLGLLPPGASAAGTVAVQGEDVLTMTPDRLRALRSRTAAMIFQDPHAAVNPLRRLGDFLLEGRPGAGDQARELIEAVGLDPRVLRQYPHQLSGGMLQRVTIAAALMGGPKLLLCDEPTTALDVTTQAEVVTLLDSLRRRYGTGLLFVTHDLDLAAAIADRVYVMYAGRIAESGPASTLFARPRHPYTAALLAATPRVLKDTRTPGRRLATIPGQPPDLRAELTGCAFAARCPRATPQCHDAPPPALALADGIVACHHSLTGAEHA